VDEATGGKDADGDEQGITGKKESNKKTGFDEDDEANEGRAAPAD